MGNIVIDGYHITDTALCEDIICNGFTYDYNPKHYLGQGIYFYNDFEIAKLNMQNGKISYGSTNSKTILHCIISAPQKQVLNLDNPFHNTKFRKFWNRIVKDIEDNKIQLIFKSEKDFSRNEYLYYKCYALDLYKKENDYNVVIKTFSIDSPTYGESIYNLKFSGIPYLERYICVSQNNYIKHKKSVYSIETEEVLFV